MKHTLIRYVAAALLLLTFAACKSGMTPLQYNDAMAHITDSLYKKGVQWGTMFSTVTSNEQYSKLQAPTQDLLQFIAASRNKVRGLEAVGKDPERLRKAMLSFLDFEEQMIKEGFMPIVNLKASSTEEDVTAAVNTLVEKAGQEDAALAGLQSAQAAYAKKNGFVISQQRTR